MKKVKIYPWTPEMIHALSGGDPVIEERMKNWNKGMAKFEEEEPKTKKSELTLEEKINNYNKKFEEYCS